MKGDKKVIEYLNKALSSELTAINQFFLHARIFKNWGLNKLNDHEYEASLEEMRHADRLIERILLLEGAPGMQDLHKLRIGKNVAQAIQNDLALETKYRELLLEAIAFCESAGDFVSRDLLQEILGGEEEDIDWMETQLQLIEQIGLQNYLQSQI